MAEHTWMDDARWVKRVADRNALFDDINAKLEALLQLHNLSLSSLRGDANSVREIPISESLNVALPTLDEFIPSAKLIEVPSVSEKNLLVEAMNPAGDFICEVTDPTGDVQTEDETPPEDGFVATTESISSNTSAVDQGEIFPSIEPNEAHSVTDEASVGRLATTESFLGIHGTPPKGEVQIAQFGLEVTTEMTPSLYGTIAMIPLLEPEDAALISEWRCTTEPPRPETRCAGSRSKYLYHARRNNPTLSPPPKPPDWTHDTVANPPPPPEPPDMRCCGVAGRRFYLTPPYHTCHIHGCLGILGQLHAYYYKNSVLQLNSDLEASLAQSSVELYQSLLAQIIGNCIVKDKVCRTDDQNCRQQVVVVDVIQDDSYEQTVINKDTDCENHVQSLSLQSLEIMPIFPYVASFSYLVPDVCCILRSHIKDSVAYLSHGVRTSFFDTVRKNLDKFFMEVLKEKLLDTIDSGNICVPQDMQIVILERACDFFLRHAAHLCERGIAVQSIDKPHAALSTKVLLKTSSGAAYITLLSLVTTKLDEYMKLTESVIWTLEEAKPNENEYINEVVLYLDSLIFTTQQILPLDAMYKVGTGALELLSNIIVVVFHSDYGNGFHPNAIMNINNGLMMLKSFEDARFYSCGIDEIYREGSFKSCLIGAQQSIIFLSSRQTDNFMNPILREKNYYAMGIFHQGKFSGRDATKVEDQALKSEIPSRGETVVKPSTKIENAAPENKVEVVISKTLVGKADGYKPAPQSKAVEVLPANELLKRIRLEYQQMKLMSHCLILVEMRKNVGVLLTLVVKVSGSSIHHHGAFSYQLRASSRGSTVANSPIDTSVMYTRHLDAYQSSFGSDLLFDGQFKF